MKPKSVMIVFLMFVWSVMAVLVAQWMKDERCVTPGFEGIVLGASSTE